MPDMIDFLLQQKATGVDPESVLDYPETVIQTLRILYDIWKIPEGAIPSKKQKSNYARWINELNELNAICPSSGKMRLAMMRSLKIYNELENKSPISSPINVKPYLISAVSEMKRADEEMQKRLPVVETKEEKERFAKKLKGLLEE